MGHRVAAVGQLADRAADREAAADHVTQARETARELLDRAKSDGRRLVDHALNAAETAEDDYGRAYREALDAGWSNPELQQMGYPAPARQRRRPASTGRAELGPGAASSPEEMRTVGRGALESAEQLGRE